MLFDRIYKPSAGELIFHYCDPNAFFGIVRTRKLWFSDVFSMNDNMEMHWGYEIFERAASELLKVASKEFFDEVDKRIIFTSENALPLVASFSLDGDVLSQWRAYAADGRGFALGFAAEEMTNLPVMPLRVLYDEQRQIEEMKVVLMSFLEAEKKKNFSYDREFSKKCYLFAMSSCALKNPAFVEEKEIRLAHMVHFVRDASGISIRSAGGTAWGRDSKPAEIAFRMKVEIPVPHVEIDFSNGGKVNPLRKVILGPTNRNLPTNVEAFLTTIGIANIKIEKSRASYTS